MKTGPCLQKIFSIVMTFVLVFTFVAVPTGVSVQARQSYIVQGTDTEVVIRLVEKHAGIVTSRLDIINGVGALLAPEAASALRSEPGIKSVVSNGTVRLTDNGADRIPATDYPDVVGAPQVWAQNKNGSGVSVAVLDTGLGWHPGLFMDVKGRLNNRILAWKDFVENRILPRDPNGHGTHVAGIIADSLKGSDDEWNGVAPGVSLVAVRVLDENGAGTYERVIQGIQWVVARKSLYRIKVMNLSIVAPVQSPYWADPLNQAVMKAWQAGITVVASAGNGGPKPMTVGVPGNNPYVITVGAFTDNYTPNNWNDDYIAPFSAAGPTLDGFVKPDVMAPGAHMVATMLPYTLLARNHEANKITPLYFSMAGTSQAAAVVSGVAALVLSKHPNLTPDEVKYRVMYTSFPWVDPVTTQAGYSIWQQGAGRVNAPDAVLANISGKANAGMNLAADIAGTTHYEGYSYYDADTQQFKMRGDFSDWSGGFGTWSGGFGTWSGGFGTWSGGFGTWSGGFGTWSGGFGTWSGGFGTWSGGFGTWSGGFGTWSGGFGTWSGGFGTWSGSEPWAGSTYANPAFISNYMAGVSPTSSGTSASINNWVEEP